VSCRLSSALEDVNITDSGSNDVHKDRWIFGSWNISFVIFLK